MRGTLRRRAEELELKRNTPAYAGNTDRFILLSAFLQEHPRVCGEHFLVAE